MAELVEHRGLGAVIGSEDVGSLKQAILKLAGDEAARQEIKKRMEDVKKEFYWRKVTEPLAGYCERVLSGEITKRKTPDKNEILFVCTPETETPVQKFMKRHLWASAQKIPFKLSSRLKRLFSFLNK